MKSSACALVAIACLFSSPTRGADLVDGVPAAGPETRPFKIIETVKPLFPVRMTKEGVTRGVVHMALHVDSEGKLVDSLVTSYTKRAFAEEARRVVEKWKYEPGRLHDSPIDTVVDLTFTFETNAIMTVPRYLKTELPGTERLRGFEYQTCNLKDLDRLPRPLSVVAPSYPQNWVEKGLTGKVTIDFYIDETGKARIPVAGASDNELLAAIAVAAVGKWEFTPPTCAGRPVLVRARQNFVFGADPAPGLSLR